MRWLPTRALATAGATGAPRAGCPMRRRAEPRSHLWHHRLCSACCCWLADAVTSFCTRASSTPRLVQPPLCRAIGRYAPLAPLPPGARSHAHLAQTCCLSPPARAHARRQLHACCAALLLRCTRNCISCIRATYTPPQVRRGKRRPGLQLRAKRGVETARGARTEVNYIKPGGPRRHSLPLDRFAVLPSRSPPGLASTT